MLFVRRLSVVTHSKYGALSKWPTCNESHHTIDRPVVEQDGSTASQIPAVALGLGSPFKHSTFKQSVEVGWERDLSTQYITYRALLDIKARQEVYVDVMSVSVLSVLQ